MPKYLALFGNHHVNFVEDKNKAFLLRRKHLRKLVRTNS